MNSAEAQKKQDFLNGVTRIVFIGNSLTDGSDYPDYVVNTINKNRPKTHIELFNAAICGNTAADLVKRLEVDVLSLKPDLVSISIGTNDCIQNRPLADYARDLEYLVWRIRETGARVLLVKPSPLTDPKLEQQYSGYLQIIDDVAKKYGAPIADAHGLFLAWMKEGKDMVGGDGVHHGANGFEGMARAVLDALGFVGVAMDKTISPWPYVLTEWKMSASFPKSTDNGTIEANQKSIAAWIKYDRPKAVSSQPWFDAPFAARGGFMPFAIEKPASPSMAFGRTTYETVTGEIAEMQVGGTLLKVWLNGELVMDTPASYMGGHPNAKRFPVRLQKGRNEIVVLTESFSFVGLKEIGASSKQVR